MNREQRWEIRYVVPTAYGNESEKVCYPRSKEKKVETLKACERLGYRVLSCKKLYPFGSYKNQHNFDLVKNICCNRMWDMTHGEAKFDEAEYDRLAKMSEKAERFFDLPLPVAWLPWEDWKDAKELAELAILHRQDACIEAGHSEWLAYC